MVGAFLALALTLLLRFGPDVPLLRAMRASLIEAPARLLAKIQRHQIIFLIIISVMMLTGGELLVLFGPELLGLFATNLALYLDAVAITALLSAATMARRVLQIIRLRLSGRRTLVAPRSRRALREVKTPVTTKEQLDDDEPAHWVLALAA